MIDPRKIMNNYEAINRLKSKIGEVFSHTDPNNPDLDKFVNAFIDWVDTEEKFKNIDACIISRGY